MHRVSWLLSFFIGAPLSLLLGVLLLRTSLPVAASSPSVLGLSTPNPPAASALFSPSFSSQFVTADARPLIIRNYLKRYASPLEPYSRTLVDISEKYSLDYRLLVAIAQQESNLCKKIPPDSHNCWGFGIYGDKVTRFDNYPQAIETVAKTLKNNYLDQGLVTPEQIMAKYTPPSVEIGGPWAKGVNQFLSELE